MGRKHVLYLTVSKGFTQEGQVYHLDSWLGRPTEEAAPIIPNQEARSYRETKIGSTVNILHLAPYFSQVGLTFQSFYIFQILLPLGANRFFYHEPVVST